MNLDEIWTFLLELIGSIIIPAWNDLIQYIPLLLLVLVIASALGLAWWWQRHSALNRPRVPRSEPGTPPPHVHLPGPSPWPFVAPIGLLLVVFAVAMGFPSSPATLALFALGAAIGLVGIIGWYRDAGREYRRIETGGHEGHVAVLGAGPETTPRRAMEPPEGIHLPGPSAWPFLAPVGLGFAVAGLIFSPILIVAGLAMGAIASLGWIRDANHELAGVEAHGHATPATRDPEAAWPKALTRLYVGIGAVALAIALLPGALSLLPNLGAATGDSQAAGPPPTNEPYISASSATEFEVTEVAVFADQPLRLTFENKQAAVPHNVAIYDTPERGTELFVGEIFEGPATRVYEVPPLPAGEYFYLCSVHPPMTGTLFSR